MGLDIHIYPEYYEHISGGQQHQMCVEEIASDYNIGRNSHLFSVMAGGIKGHITHFFPIKGLPIIPLSGDAAQRAMNLTVVPDHEFEKEHQPHRHVRESVIKKMQNVHTIRAAAAGPGNRQIILNPNYHSHSWLSASEMFIVRKIYIQYEMEFNYKFYNETKKSTAKQLKLFKTIKDPVQLFNYNFGPFESASLNGLISMLFAIEKTDPHLMARIVFWFDN